MEGLYSTLDAEEEERMFRRVKAVMWGILVASVSILGASLIVSAIRSNKASIPDEAPEVDEYDTFKNGYSNGFVDGHTDGYGSGYRDGWTDCGEHTATSPEHSSVV